MPQYLTIRFEVKKNNHVTPAERRALSSLQQKHDIVITKADKGKTTMVIKRTDYVRKVKQHLADGPYKLRRALVPQARETREWV